MRKADMDAEYDVVIVGGGAAGLSAAIYTTRAQLKTLVAEQLAPGGQILNTSDIENYPGFPDGVLGPDIGMAIHRQAENTGTEFAFDQVIELKVEGDTKVVVGEEREYTAKTIIITTGGEHNKLGVPGEEEFAGRGVTYCATCDGNFFKGQDTVVVGGGDAAIDEGMYLSRIVKSLTVVHRRDELRATKVLQERAFATENVSFKLSHAVKEIRGNGSVDRVLLEDLKTGEEYEHPTSGVFIYIGFHPNSGLLQDTVSLDPGGHVITDIRMETNVPGVFAAGDVRQYSDRQLGTSVGDGITAALSAYRYITEG
jgi:thioredoxin reductase (NADPH)